MAENLKITLIHFYLQSNLDLEAVRKAADSLSQTFCYLLQIAKFCLKKGKIEIV